MPGYLKVDGTWIPVVGIAIPQGVTYDRPVFVETTLGGTRKAQIGPRAHRDWSVRLEHATPEMLRLWERVIDGVYGPGPFDWIDPFANVTEARPSGGGEGWTWESLGDGQIRFTTLGVHGTYHWSVAAYSGAAGSWVTSNSQRTSTYEFTTAGEFEVETDHTDPTLYSVTVWEVTPAMLASTDGSPSPAPPRSVVLRSLGRSDWQAWTTAQRTAVSLTLTEVGP